MKKTISLFFGLLLLPTGLYAGESSLIFDDSSSFQTALSLKLGHAMGEMEKPNKGGVEKGGLCESDADCSSSEKCKGNTCVNVCDPNPCSSGYCLDEGNHSYSCVACLNDDHCSADKKCSGNVCVDVCTGNNCTQQSKLCSSNGNHGYLCYGCTSDEACADEEFCDTSVKTCRTLCPDSCEGNLICELDGSHKAKCSCEKDEDCPEGYTCDQETKQCVAADCAGMLLASRDDVAIAVDAASFSTAMSSGKNIIAVTENLTVSSSHNLGNKSLVGPKYFADIPICKETPTPTITHRTTLSIAGGVVSDLNFKMTSYNPAISGQGTIKNVAITNQNGYAVSGARSGELKLEGNITLTTNDDVPIHDGIVTINGSTSITNTGCPYAVFQARKLTINAPVTVKTACSYNVNKSRDNPHLFNRALGPIYVNSSVKVISGSLSMIYFEGGTLSFGSTADVGGNIGGYAVWYSSDWGSRFPIKKGAKLEIGGICRKASSDLNLDPTTTSGSIIGGNMTTTKVYQRPPNPPFSSGC